MPNRSSSPTVIEGTQIGGYRVLHRIGEGGMGEVWLAEHSMLGRRAAVKILHAEFSQRQDIVTRFFNEARAATAISDPGIIQIFDFGYHSDGSAYIVMEALEGEPLDKRLRRQGALSVADALRIGRQVASSVGAAHARGIVHRDLKPENIFMVRDPEVPGGERAKVLDFGIAKLAGDLGSSQKTSTSAIIGTPTYMSPEQCRGAGGVDQRSDVYSLGCVLFALVTGNAPFNAEGTGALIVQHMTEPPPRPSTRLFGVPGDVDDLILRCLAKDPAQRFHSATELAHAIEALLTGGNVNAPTRFATAPGPMPSNTTLGSSAASIVGSSVPPSPGRKGLYVGLAVVVLAGGGIAAVLASRGDAKSEADPIAETPTPTTTAAATVPVAPPVEAKPVDPKPAEAKSRIQALLQTFVTWGPAHVGAACPTTKDLGDAVDPWGHAYEITCTDQPGGQTIGVVSRGPDGTAGTDDDLTSWTMGKEITDLARGPRWVTTPIAVAEPTDKKPIDKKPIDKKKSEKKPAIKKPGSGIVDLDGDGIPDSL